MKPQPKDIAPSMEPQPFCSLPWCGASFGSPYKTRIVGGRRLTYPERIDAHHPFGRPGPVVYICHECHMKHHAAAPGDSTHLGITWTKARGWTCKNLPLRVAAEWDL